MHVIFMKFNHTRACIVDRNVESTHCAIESHSQTFSVLITLADSVGPKRK